MTMDEYIKWLEEQVEAWNMCPLGNRDYEQGYFKCLADCLAKAKGYKG